MVWSAVTFGHFCCGPQGARVDLRLPDLDRGGDGAVFVVIHLRQRFRCRKIFFADIKDEVLTTAFGVDHVVLTTAFGVDHVILRTLDIVISLFV